MVLLFFDLLMEPGLSHTPFSLYCSGGYTQSLGSVFDSKSSEDAKLNHVTLLWVDF